MIRTGILLAIGFAYAIPVSAAELSEGEIVRPDTGIWVCDTDAAAHRVVDGMRRDYEAGFDIWQHDPECRGGWYTGAFKVMGVVDTVIVDNATWIIYAIQPIAPGYRERDRFYSFSEHTIVVTADENSI